MRRAASQKRTVYGPSQAVCRHIGRQLRVVQAHVLQQVLPNRVENPTKGRFFSQSKISYGLALTLLLLCPIRAAMACSTDRQTGER